MNAAARRTALIYLVSGAIPLTSVQEGGSLRKQYKAVIISKDMGTKLFVFLMNISNILITAD